MRGRAQPQRCFASGACHLLGVLPWFGREVAPDEGCSARSNQAWQTLTPGRLLMFGSLAALALIAAPAPAFAVAQATPQTHTPADGPSGAPPEKLRNLTVAPQHGVHGKSAAVSVNTGGSLK